jgi:hypothetical protein
MGTPGAPWTSDNLGDDPGIAGWREAFRLQGLKPSRYRTSPEALARRVLRGDRIQTTLPVVNAYNAVSVRQPGMDPQAHRQVHTPLLRQANIELAQGLDDPQSSPHRPLGVILMREGIAEVDEQAIAEILGDTPLKAADDLGARVLIGPYHLAPLFGVELAGERGRVHQVTKQHRELAAFGLKGRRSRCWCGRLRRAGRLGSKRESWRCRLGSAWGGCR